MKRGLTGRYEVTSVGGEQVRAFIPSALPPQPPLDLTNARQRLLERATLALGRLDSVTLLLPDPQIFLYAYVRREAVHLRASLSFATAAKAMDRLMAVEIVSELTGRQRNRVFAYDRYLAILNEGTEPI